MNYQSIYQEVLLAEKRIRKHILKTPLIESHSLSQLIKGKVYLKCENEQYTGSFKARGSLNKILSLSEEERSKRLVTASTGNHALGFSRSLQIADKQGVIYLPSYASKAKTEVLSHYPVELIYHDGDSLQTEIYAKKVAEENGRIWISPYNDPMVIGGQGTIATELENQLDNFDYLLATVGGGGLISGIGSYLKTKRPNVKIIACQPENSPEMTLSLEAGRIIDLSDQLETLSDGSAGGIEPGAITFELCQQIIDESILVTEKEIKDALKLIVHEHKKIIEGSAAVAVASLIKEKKKFRGSTVVIVLCGANIDIAKLVDILGE